MNWKKALACGLAGWLTAMSALTAGAAEVPDAETRIGSEIAAGAELKEEDAAMRLYYLGLLTGTGTNSNGGIDFALGNGLTRVESAVLAVRLMGQEEYARSAMLPHPFYDVPEWASPYVGYLYSLGLLDDLLDGMFGPMFEPNFAETSERFMSYMLHALGYRMNAGDYTYAMAAECGRQIGLCVTEEDEPLTRGDAALAMYNTLRATMKDSRQILSDALVEQGRMDYQDAVFMLWSDDTRETEVFLEAVGYRVDWTIPDGYYTITSAESGKALNVASSGANTDYEGVGMTTWDATGDITQTFRIERTERGTYYIYSAASRSGFGRVIGAGTGVSEAGLYSATSRNAMEFYIRGCADGSWEIVSASRENQYLSSPGLSVNGGKIVLSDAPQSWNFKRQGIVNSEGRELAIFVSESLVVTQGAYDDYSHMEQNALDIQPMERAVRAPFDGQIVRIDATQISCNAVWFQSASPVLYADGTYDYMTVCFLHDNDISDLYVGQGFTQGDYFYDSGDYGVSAGKHVHVAVYRGEYNGGMRCGSGDVYAEDAFFLPDDTYIYNSYGLNWKKMSTAG